VAEVKCTSTIKF